MHLIPLALGIVAIVVGIAMVAYGIPINEFGTGNTLIAAGTTAISAGFILLGLWVAVVQLQRLSGMPEPRSARPSSGRGTAPNTDRVRYQSEAGGLPQFEDSRLAPEPAPDREPASGPASQPPAERMSWLPQEPEPEPEPRGERLPTGGRLGSRQEESSWEMFAPSRNSGPARERSFETIWPSDRPREGRETALPGDRPERSPEPGPTQDPGAQPATILKSGVINGMAYTLYADGSIEAELPQGTLRFGSLEELRDYLAGNA
jgi:hypothetical protein